MLPLATPLVERTPLAPMLQWAQVQYAVGLLTGISQDY
jgi:hypothetical protein